MTIIKNHNENVLYPSEAENKKQVKLFIVCLFITSLIFVIDIHIPLGVAGGVPYITTVLLALWLPAPNSSIWFAVACSVLTVIGFFYSPSGGEMWKVLFNRGLALFAIWTAGILVMQKKIAEEKREKAVNAREKALNDIKILRGMLPICASCKMIRDDDGYWNQIEVYIKNHSEADFSHGVCPECIKKLYPEFQGKL